MTNQTGTPDGDPYGDLDEVGMAEERIKMRRLVLWLSVFLMFPGFTIGGAFVLFDDWREHEGHIAVSFAFGLLGLFLALLSRRLATRYV